jgi:hypothetical protein
VLRTLFVFFVSLWRSTMRITELMCSNSVIIEQTPTTLVVRNHYQSLRTKLFGGVITSIAGGRILLSVVTLSLSGLAVIMLPGTGLIAEGVVGMVGGILLIGVVDWMALNLGVRSLRELRQPLYPEAQLWTFDKTMRTLFVTRQLRNRVDNTVILRQIASYPLPEPGAVQAISGYSGDDFWAQLVVSTAGGELNGLKHRRLISGNLKREAQRINQFLGEDHDGTARPDTFSRSGICRQPGATLPLRVVA